MVQAFTCLMRLSGLSRRESTFPYNWYMVCFGIGLVLCVFVFFLNPQSGMK